MALSVLVALMMLAVPLASSSNLFVDGGQTNSNGDAPALGAAGDIITFELNIPENSLDKINYTTLKAALKDVTGIIFSVDEKKGTILAIDDGTQASGITIESIINKVNEAINAQFRGEAYSHEWMDSNGSIYYAADKLDESFTLTAQWALNEDEYAEVNVNSTIDGAAQEVKTKAYAYSTYDDDNDASTPEVVDKTQIVITTDNDLPVDESLIKGYVFNTTEDEKNISVYDHKVTDSSNKIIKAPADKDNPVTIPVSDLTVTYTFNNEDYKKVVISSNIFEEPVTLYADKNVAAGYTYSDVFTALGKATPEGKTKAYIDTSYTVEDKNSYTMKNWTDNGDIYALESLSPAGTELTLNADYNKFNVTFMVKGQVQVAEVLYGEFSESVCTLDTSGITKWVSLPVDSNNKVVYSGESFKPTIFNFNDPKLQDTIINNNLVLVALFTDPAKTYYVTFDAKAGYFGDKESGVQNVVVPISSRDATADQIALPNDPTNYTVAQGMKSVFAYWYSSNENTKYDFSNETEVTENLVLNAKYIDYKYTISFNVDNNIVGYLYYDASKLVAFEYNGIAYTYSAGLDNINLTAGDDDSRALSALLYPIKAGYTISEWKDADGNVMISGIVHDLYEEATKPPKYEQVTGVTLHYTAVKEDMSLYANFEAKEYVIAYNGNTATMTNVLPQIGTVDQSLNLFGDSVFGNEGYVLKEWNTRPDGKGTSYALGASFTLTGAEFEKLGKLSIENSDISNKEGFTLYAIWEKSGSGSGSGNNNEGNNDSNTDTYLLAGILVVIIVLIIVVAVVLRKKQ